MLAALARYLTTTRLLLAILLIGGALRITLNDIVQYSPADEAHYVASTRFLQREGWSAYPRLVQHQLDHRQLHDYPGPLRWGYLGLTSLTCTVRGSCDARSLAWLSTIAGIGAIAATFFLGARLVGSRAALLAAAFTVTSPLQLALGRRALQDEVYCAVFLVAFWALVRLLQDEGSAAGRRWRVAAFIGAATLAFAIKEAFAFPYAAFAVIYLVAPRERRLGLEDALILAAPPALFVAGFVLLSGSLSSFFVLLRLSQASFLVDYSAAYQSGPPHRPLFDLFVLAPIVGLLAAAALALVADGRRKADEGGGERWLALFLVIALAAFMGLPKNARFVIILDPVIRLLAAWTLITHHLDARGLRPRWAVLAVIANAAPELALFHTTFVAHDTVDPTTTAVLQALGALPRPAAQPPAGSWPLAFFAGLAVVIAGVAIARRSPEERRARTLGGAAATAALVAGLLAWRSPAAPSAAPAADLDPATAEVVAGVNAASPTEAIAHLRRALEINPSHYGATYQLARALDRAGRREEARAQWERAEQLAMKIGLEALYTNNDPETAAARFREVLALSPDHYGATYQLATALDRARRPAEARPLWEKMARMAAAIGDAGTAEKARARLSQTP